MVLNREFSIIVRFAKHRQRLVHFYRFICTRKYKLKCGDLHLISFLVTKFKYVCMKFMINELLYRRVWTVYDYRVNLSHVLFVMHQICLINRNLNKNIYFKQLK